MSEGSLLTVAQQLVDLSRLAEANAHALRTRPDYDIRCSSCGAPHWIDTSIPSDIWNQIAEPSDLLCMLCIDERLQAKGLTAKATFHYSGIALKGEE